jgi:hypothetical protein
MTLLRRTYTICWGRFHSNEDVEVAVRERVRVQVPDFYRDGILKFLPRWDRRISVPGDCVEK